MSGDSRLRERLRELRVVLGRAAWRRVRRRIDLAESRIHPRQRRPGTSWRARWRAPSRLLRASRSRRRPPWSGRTGRPSSPSSLPLESRTRAPNALGRHPSVASSVPALVMSLMSFSIRAMWSDARGNVRFRCLVNRQESHTYLSFSRWLGPPRPTPSLTGRTEGGEIDIPVVTASYQGGCDAIR